MKLRNDDDITKAGASILEKTNAAYVVLTLSEEGIAVFEKNGFFLLSQLQIMYHINKYISYFIDINAAQTGQNVL